MKFFSFFFFFSKVKAHHKIYSPIVEEGRQSFEWRGHFDLDDRAEINKAHHHVLETEYSWTSYWQSELEFHLSDKENTPWIGKKLNFKINCRLLITKTGLAAFYFSYNFVSERDEADEIEYKYLNKFYGSDVGFISNFILKSKSEKQLGVQQHLV